MKGLLCIIVLLNYLLPAQQSMFNTDKTSAAANALNIQSFHPGGFKRIEKYSRFEIGLQLPSNVQSEVKTFLSSSGTSGINPYDSRQLHVYCRYIHNSSGKVYLRNGFCFQDFFVVENVWTELPTTHNFRIRFAPPQPGAFTAYVNVLLNEKLLTTESFTFNVIESDNPGHLGIENSLCKMKFSNGTMFFGMGENIPWADFHGDNPNFPKFTNFWEGMSSPITHDIQRGYIKDLGINGGNFVRIRLDPWSVPIESINKRERPFPPAPHYPWQLTKYISNYHHNQMFMWEMDKTLETCEQNRIYILLTLMGDYELSANDTSNGGSGTLAGWLRNPYSGLLNDNTVNGIHKFFTSDVAKTAFKKRLMYLDARWGYSTSLGLWSFINETENMSHDELSGPPYYLWDDPNSTLKTDFAYWVCEMQEYLHTFYPRHLVTNGTTDGRIKGTNANLFLPCSLDVECKHDYTYEFDTVNQRYVSRDYNRNEFSHEQFYKKQPFLYGEIGLVADVAELSISGDAFYHNSIWSSLFSGVIATSLNWFDWHSHRGINHRLNFKAMKAFVDKIPFNHELLPYSNFPATGGHIEWPFNDVLTYWLKKPNNQEVWGWARNNSFNWMSDAYPNLSPSEQANVRERVRWDGTAEFKDFEEDDKKIKLKHLNRKHKYKIEIYSTRGEGELLEIKYAKTDKNGLLEFGRKMPHYIESPWFPDYAFILTDLDLEYTNKGADKVYPVPTKAKLFVEPDPVDWINPWFELFDELGRKISADYIDGSINTQHIPSGFYILKIRDDSQEKSFKIIVIH